MIIVKLLCLLAIVKDGKILRLAFYVLNCINNLYFLC
jgi:hypothetical protein